MSSGGKKLWGGVFTTQINANLEKLNTSINVDKRLHKEDLEGSKAYATVLQKVEIITKYELKQIIEGLNQIEEEWRNGDFVIFPGDEDIHSANERRLKELIGDTASKLHTGRSRNDQVVTDVKMWMRSSSKELETLLKNLIKAIVDNAKNNIEVLMPGYTHLQRAQPVRWSHFILSYAWTFKNDTLRLEEIIKRNNTLPLGSGALAGNPFNIDRKYLAELLQFDDVTENSMQTTGDRDFISEFLFWASLLGVHLSRLAEDLIIFSTKEFGFLTLHQSFSTGSSLMPQKRNPDSLELIRGIGGSLFGQCCGFMMTLKSLPSTYNKDLQSDKECLFDAFDKLKSLLEVAQGVLDTLQLNPQKCREALSSDMLATDLAYYLVRKGIPFREAHEAAGRVVALAEKSEKFLQDVTLEELKNINASFDVDVSGVWNFENSIEQYQSTGGTSRKGVVEQISKIEKWINY